MYHEISMCLCSTQCEHWPQVIATCGPLIHQSAVRTPGRVFENTPLPLYLLRRLGSYTFALLPLLLAVCAASQASVQQPSHAHPCPHPWPCMHIHMQDGQAGAAQWQEMEKGPGTTVSSSTATATAQSESSPDLYLHMPPKAATNGTSASSFRLAVPFQPGAKEAAASNNLSLHSASGTMTAITRMDWPDYQRCALPYSPQALPTLLLNMHAQHGPHGAADAATDLWANPSRSLTDHHHQRRLLGRHCVCRRGNDSHRDAGDRMDTSVQAHVLFS